MIHSRVREKAASFLIHPGSNEIQHGIIAKAQLGM